MAAELEIVEARAAHQRLIESVKFELDVRGSIAQKHMEV